MTVGIHGLRALAAGVATAALLAASSAGAQTSTADGRVVYEAAWFAQFGPSTAWDMASRVPGFAVESGEAVRGFAGAAGNVVVNGSRPSAKADTPETLLRRIPASQVVRMEVVPGSVLGGEFRSKPQVLNVVMNTAGSLSTSSEVVFRRSYNGDVGAAAKASVLRRTPTQSLTVALEYEDSPNPDEGYDVFFLEPGRNLIERREKTNLYRNEQASASVNWAWTFAPDSVLRLNGVVYDRGYPLDHNSYVSNAGGPLRHDTISDIPNTRGGEAGADLTWPYAGGTLKLIGLVRRENFRHDEVFLNFDPSDAMLGGVEQLTDNDSGETLGRAVWSRENLFGWSLEAGGEFAKNFLDAAVDLSAVDAAGGRTPISLTVAHALVSELRGEAFVALGRKLSPTLSLDGGLAVETSSLKVTGDARAERALTYFKPRGSLEWRPDDALRLRAAVERRVAQLDFTDFISGAELSNGRVSSGNPNLQPEQTWRASFTAERRLLGDGKLTATVYSDWVSMVQDRIPVDVGLDGPGNLGEGRRTGADVALDVPVDRFGVRGGRFGLRWLVQDSSVRDPYTLTDRPFSGEFPWTFDANFRQDLTRWPAAWGVSYHAQGPIREYRMNEVDTWSNVPREFGAFVEYRPGREWVVRLDAQNLLDREIIRDRVFNAPDRSSPVVSAYEERHRWNGRTLLLSIKRTTG